MGTATSEARDRLADEEAVLRGGGIEATSEVLPGQPETVISERVESENYGLLVMGAYGHSRIRNLIIGSTTTAPAKITAMDSGEIVPCQTWMRSITSHGNRL